jgi:elongation factor G
MKAPRPILFVAIEAKTPSDQERLAHGLQHLASEISDFRIDTDVRTGQTIVAGMAELQLEFIVERLRSEFNVQATFTGPRVAYTETFTKQAEGEGRYVRQIEGHGHYAHVKIRLLPAQEGSGFAFESLVGDIIPSEFVKAVDEGIREALTHGVLAGYPIDGVRVELYDGSFHEVDSSVLAFKAAASMAFQDAAKKAGPVVLEPIMAVEVVVPEEYMGDIIRDLNSRRGRIEGLELQGTVEIIRSRVPLSELFGYADNLRSQAMGKASHSMEFDQYEALPGGLNNQDDDPIAPVVALLRHGVEVRACHSPNQIASNLPVSRASAQSI